MDSIFHFERKLIVVGEQKENENLLSTFTITANVVTM
jgi:hypothetical protein